MCEGHTHAVAAALVGDAILTWYANPSLPVLLGATALFAGVGIANDLDHHDSTMVRAFGPLTWLLAKIVQFIGGGRPRITHSLFIAAAATGITAFEVAENHHGSDVAATATVLTLAVLFAGGFRGLAGPWVKRRKDNGLIEALIGEVGGLFAGAFMVRDDFAIRYLPAVVLIGMITHMAFDSITKDGCPWFWPFSKKMFRLMFRGLCFHTGSKVETVLAAVLSLALLYVLLAGSGQVPGGSLFA